jgi:hypothetical protein
VKRIHDFCRIIRLAENTPRAGTAFPAVTVRKEPRVYARCSLHDAFVIQIPEIVSLPQRTNWRPTEVPHFSWNIHQDENKYASKFLRL